MVESYIRDVPDFPKKGILFKDITPLLQSPEGLRESIEGLERAVDPATYDLVCGIESRGFIFGAALAARMSASFVPARKPGKLPRAVDRVEYALEYGTDCIELHADALQKGERVLIIDDVIATGGTAAAAVELAKRQHAEVLGCGFVIELDFLNGREKIAGTPVYSLLRY